MFKREGFVEFKKQSGNWHVILNITSQYLLYFFIVNGLNVDGCMKILLSILISSIIITSIEHKSLRRLLNLKRLSYTLFLLMIIIAVAISALIDSVIDYNNTPQFIINAIENDGVKIYRLIIFSGLMIVPTISHIIFSTAKEFK